MTESRTAYRAGKGGPNRGQGRKPDPNKRQMISIRLPPEIVEKLKQEEDYTALIEKLLKQHYQL
jgi:hypothetical protein